MYYAHFQCSYMLAICLLLLYSPSAWGRSCCIANKLSDRESCGCCTLLSKDEHTIIGCQGCVSTVHKWACGGTACPCTVSMRLSEAEQVCQHISTLGFELCVVWSCSWHRHPTTRGTVRAGNKVEGKKQLNIKPVWAVRWV